MSMLISYPILFEEALPIIETEVFSLIIENRNAYRTFIIDLFNQKNGLDGEIVFSKNLSTISFKDIDVINDVFSITLNNKSMLTKLFSEMEKFSQQGQFSETIMQINSLIQKLIVDISDELNVDITNNELFNIKDLIKSYSVKFYEENQYDLTERLIQYMNNSINLLGTKLFVLINLKVVFNKEEIKELYKYFILNKIPVVILQSEIIFKTENEKLYIIDDSLCSIY